MKPGKGESFGMGDPALGLNHENTQAGGLRSFLMQGGGLLLRGRCLSGLGPGEDGAVSAGAREEDGEADGAEHEDDGGVGGQLGEKVGCAARAEGRLGALTAEGSGEVGRFALLKEDDADDEERDDDVKSNEKTDQHSACNLLDPERNGRRKCVDSCGGGDLNPYALRR